MTKEDPDILCPSCRDFDYGMNRRGGVSNDVLVVCEHDWKPDMNEEPKPCPFCGSKNLVVTSGEAGALIILCCSCFANGPEYWERKEPTDQMEKQAIKAWNKRL